MILGTQPPPPMEVEQLSQSMPPSFVWALAQVECPINMDLVWMVMTHCYCGVCIISFFVCGFSVALRDDRSHMGESDDMRFLVFIGGVSMEYCGLIFVHGCVH